MVFFFLLMLGGLDLGVCLMKDVVVFFGGVEIYFFFMFVVLLGGGFFWGDVYWTFFCLGFF